MWDKILSPPSSRQKALHKGYLAHPAKHAKEDSRSLTTRWEHSPLSLGHLDFRADEPSSMVSLITYVQGSKATQFCKDLVVKQVGLPWNALASLVVTGLCYFPGPQEHTKAGFLYLRPPLKAVTMGNRLKLQRRSLSKARVRD